MIGEPIISYAEDAILDESACEYHNKHVGPFMLDSTLYLPAGEVMTSRSKDPDGRYSVDVGVATGKTGLFTSFTPEGARAFAAKMIESADEIDALMAPDVAAAIDKARKSGDQA